MRRRRPYFGGGRDNDLDDGSAENSRLKDQRGGNQHNSESGVDGDLEVEEANDHGEQQGCFWLGTRWKELDVKRLSFNQ